MKRGITFNGLDKNEIMDIETDHEVSLYNKRGLPIVKGQGTLVWDIEGNEYFDCVSGIGVANIGHSHPLLVEVLQDQASELITCPEIFYNSTRAKLIQKLVDLSPVSMNKVFLCNSGSEAIEAAIKFARFSTGRSKIISIMRGFHGRTLGALSATFNPKYRKPFAPLIPGFDFVPLNNIERMREQADQDTAAIILEVVQGNGGIHLVEPAYLEEVRTLCNELGILLIIDEIQTGMGRTGKMFAFEHFSIVPDIICIAKALGGGIPIGAVITNETVKMKKALHGSTFGGNPLACSAALATLKIIEEEELIDNALTIGNYLYEQLQKIKSELIRDIRHLGLMVGIELKQRVFPYISRLMEHGVLTNPAGSTVIRLLPPLCLTKDEVDQIVKIIEIVLTGD